MKRAKIVCTIGPATSSPKVLAALMKAGMDVARLNFSHGTHREHSTYIRHVREQARRLKKPVAVLQDLQGIKIRIGEVEGGSIRLKRGREVSLRPGTGVSTEDTLFVSYPALLKDLRVGHRVLLDDGLMELKLKRVGKGSALASVKEGGYLTANKGVNLPDTAISLSPFTKKDRRDLEFGLKRGVDAVAVSFVLGHEDVERVKEFLRRKGANIPVIAKVEKPEALKNIDSILDSADGIMVARGDLGVEVAPQEVPVIQKNLIRKANESSKLVITATQMLESMREHPRPTRAEATDVANSVLDGTDALMLSAETSIGKYPVQAVRMMRSIVETTERRAVEGKVRAYARASATHPEDPPSNAIAEAAVRASSDVGAKSIAAFTRTGFTALLVSKCRPVVPVIAFTPDETVIRRMSFFWGVSPLFMRLMENTDKMVSEAERALVRAGVLNKGDLMVVVASSPLHAYGRTNFLKIHKVGRAS